jgi:hypothetical protein
VLRAAGEVETTQENIQNWLELRRRPWILASDRGRNCCSDISLFIFISTTYINEFSVGILFSVY